MTAPAQVPSRLGPFEVGAKIGGGGMASVYVGRRVDGEPPNEIVALKLIRDELAKDKQYTTMFLDEAKILSRLSHPDIILTRDYGVDGDTRFIAMELLLGRSLFDAYERCAELGERMPLDLAAFVALRVAQALEYAHGLTSEKGEPLHVIHRDVNPTNVFVAYDGTVKLIDFGLAKSSARLSRSGEGIVKGKVPYLTPEQIEDKPFDHRIDVYGLGATLWEMTTGRRLFKRDTDVATLKAIRDHDVPDPRTLVSGIYPDALWSIVERALARDPAARYESAGAMADDLAAFLEKKGRKGDLQPILAAWLEELFPGERAKQETWLAEVSAVRAPEPSAKTMAPPAPVAEVPAKPKVEEEKKPEAIAPAANERHPFAALLAAAATVGFFFLLALVFRQC